MRYIGNLAAIAFFGAASVVTAGLTVGFIGGAGYMLHSVTHTTLNGAFSGVIIVAAAFAFGSLYATAAAATGCIDAYHDLRDELDKRGRASRRRRALFRRRRYSY